MFPAIRGYKNFFRIKKPVGCLFYVFIFENKIKKLKINKLNCANFLLDKLLECLFYLRNYQYFFAFYVGI